MLPARIQPVALHVHRAAVSSSRIAVHRRFASQSTGDSSRSVPTSPAGGSSRAPFVIGGAVIFFLVAGRYILASDKPARSEHAAQQKAQREGDVSKEYRDPRDSGVKTMEQKRQKSQSS